MGWARVQVGVKVQAGVRVQAGFRILEEIRDRAVVRFSPLLWISHGLEFRRRLGFGPVLRRGNG